MQKNLIEILNQPTTKLTKVDLYIQKQINLNIPKIANMKIQELAIFCNCSPATISRFIKKFGFKRYVEFIIFINKNYEIIKLKYLEKPNSLLDDIIYSYKYSVDNAIMEGEKNKIEASAQLIKTSKQILLVGMGSSFNACDELCSNLNRIKMHVYTSKDFHRLLCVLGTMNKHDLLIIFSNRALSNEINFIIDVSRRNNIPSILITSNKLSKIFKKANITITHLNEKQGFRASALSSKLSQSIIGDAIYRKIVFGNKKYLDYLKNSQKVILNWEKSAYVYSNDYK